MGFRDDDLLPLGGEPHEYEKHYNQTKSKIDQTVGVYFVIAKTPQILPVKNIAPIQGEYVVYNQSQSHLPIE